MCEVFPHETYMAQNFIFKTLVGLYFITNFWNLAAGERVIVLCSPPKTSKFNDIFIHIHSFCDL